MKKLKLQADELRVETFTTAGAPGGKGTVQGHYGTNHTMAGETCDYQSCLGTCGGDTCDYTCAGYATSPGPEYHCIEC